MSALGQKQKGSERADVVRFSPQSGHRELASVCPFSAMNGREQVQQHAY
jgi:hypothetical protein